MMRMSQEAARWESIEEGFITPLEEVSVSVIRKCGVEPSCEVLVHIVRKPDKSRDPLRS